MTLKQQGGYRAYYPDPANGSMQGGNVAGGLGLDREFFESVLPANVMLYGFLGLHLMPEGISISPHLPSSWPSLTITRIHLRDQIVDMTVAPKHITISGLHSSDEPFEVIPADNSWTITKSESTIDLSKK